MKSESDSGLTFLWIGLGLGLLTGLLWAPRRGREIRGELRSGAAARWSSVTEESAKLRHESRRWLAAIKERFCKTNGGTGGERPD